MFKNAFIPYKGYWSTPFSRWQGSLMNENAIVLGAATAKKAFELRSMDPALLDGLYLGWSVPQPSCFYGGPWFAGMMGAGHTSGPMFSQACATSASTVGFAGSNVETGMYSAVLVAMADRLSNGPHLVYPNPVGPGGQPKAEDWVMDNFSNDPWAKNAMIQTAENVAKEAGITREECDECALDRYHKYMDSLADDRAFQKRYMVACDIRKGKKVIEVSEDEGIFPTTAESMAGLRPVLPNGVLTYGSQTHPADGNIGIVVASQEMAKQMSSDDSVTIQLMSYGYARVEKGAMAKAPVPAGNMALDKAGIKVADLAAVKTHNPFAVNDVYMRNEMGIDDSIFNNYGSSLVFGHPQSPTGGRLIIELIEELAQKGGGYGLFTGCAAGDTGAALVVKVS